MRRTSLSRLRVQLMLSYLPLIVAPVLAVSLVTRRIAVDHVDDLLMAGQRAQGELFTSCLAGYYQSTGSWSGVDSVFSVSAVSAADDSPSAFEITAAAGIPPGSVQPDSFRPARPPASLPAEQMAALESLTIYNAHCFQMVSPIQFTSIRPVPIAADNANTFAEQGLQQPAAAVGGGSIGMNIADPPVPPLKIMLVAPDNTIIAGNKQPAVGTVVDAGVVAAGFPVLVNERKVGTVVIEEALDQQRNQLLDVVNTALLVSGAVSVALAAGFGWELSRRITRPVRDLMSGVRRLASGEWRTDEPSAELPVRSHSHSEIGELTRAFNNMANEITRQQRMNKQMVADIAHDLRTPLSAMALDVEAIEAGYQTAEQAAASLREEIDWLKRLVDDLRLLSLIDADQIVSSPSPTEMTTFLCRVLDFWQTVAADAGCELRLNMPPQLSVIEIDAAQIKQVLGNLIDNAIQHSASGGRIELGASFTAAEFALWVTDDGDGILPQDLPRVFDRFYRADRSRQHEKLGGSGLGLSIAKRLVELHGGMITVSSIPGKGTTFMVRLPHHDGTPSDEV